MAEFHRAENGAPWFSITWRELAEYSGNSHPVCDTCVTSLTGQDNIVLIPLLNEVYCPKCGKAQLDSLYRYSKDAYFEKHRTQFYLDYFKIGKGAHS